MRTWTVPGYTEVGELGAGGSAQATVASEGFVANQCRLAEHMATGARVAIRYLSDDRRLDAAWLAAYRDDTRRLAELESPHVVGLYEYVEAADGVATVHEYVDGVTLAELAAGGKPMRPEAALSVLKGALVGLTAAHAAGVRRCRYTRTSVLVDGDGHTRLTDGTDAIADGTPTDYLAEDVAAAFVAFQECAGLARLPKPLRRLEPAAGDGTTLLAELDIAARAAYGADWEAKARRQLARSVDRVRRQRQVQRQVQR